MFERFSTKPTGLTKQQLDVHLPQMDILHTEILWRNVTQLIVKCVTELDFFEKL